MMEDIENKLKKYNDTYVPGEKTSKEYNRQLKQSEAVKSRHLTAECLFNEVTFTLKQYEKDHVHHLIDMYPNFKDLHKTASNETIILAFIFYTKIPYNTNIKLNKYYITSKYNLTHNTFEIIICRLTLNYLRELYIIPYEPKDIDHNLLYKGEIR